MIYAIGFDGVIATGRGASLAFMPDAESGLRALLKARHEVIVWTARMGPSASAAERAEVYTLLGELLAKYGPDLRVATAETDGPKPLADLYVDEKAVRFARANYPGAGVTWSTLVSATTGGKRGR